MLILLLCASIGLDVARELCFKLGSRAEVALSPPAAANGRTQLLSAERWWVLCGFVCWGIELLAWTCVLAQLPLNVAFPIMSLSYALTPLASLVVLKESISRQRWLGIGLITSGAAIVGSTGIG